MASVDVVIPVLNEEQALPVCIEKLRAFLGEHLSEHQWRIVVADNGSADRTLEIAEEHAKRFPKEVAAIHLDVRGRGLALRTAWLASEADVVSYMDVDLSTGLQGFPPLVNAIAKDGYHVAIGTRLGRGAQTTRSVKRELISRAYNLVIKLGMWTRFSDAQCGFKAVSGPAARVLVPAIVNNHWFFDTELLVIAEKRGFRIKEVPVVWAEDPDTRVKIVQTAMEDLKGLWRLRRGGIPRVSPPDQTSDR